MHSRTEKLGEQLQAFEAEAAVLKTWLLTAKMKLADIKHLSEKDQQSIATIRSKNDKLLVGNSFLTLLNVMFPVSVIFLTTSHS